MKETNELAGIKKYTASELLSIVPMDKWAARDEAHRRHAALAKRFAKIKNQMDSMALVIEAANAA